MSAPCSPVLGSSARPLHCDRWSHSAATAAHSLSGGVGRYNIGVELYNTKLHARALAALSAACAVGQAALPVHISAEQLLKR